MNRRLVNRLPKNCVCIFVHIDQGGPILYATKLSDKNVFEDPLSYSDITSVVRVFGKRLPYILQVSGLGVLTRLVEATQGYKDQLILQSDKNTFYFNSYFDDAEVLVTFFRKSLTEELEKELVAHRVQLVGIYAGLVPVIYSATTAISAFGYHLQISGGKMQQLERMEEEYPILESMVLAQRGLLEMYRSYTSTQWEQGLSEEDEQRAKEECSQQTKFYRLAYGVVILVFTLLLANYFVQRTLYSEIQELENTISLNNSNLTLLGQLQNEQSRKAELVETSGLLHPELLSFYADKLMGTVPSGITLQEVALFPLKEPLKEEKRVVLEQDQLRVMGSVSSSEVLDDWMERINRFSWVQNVELIDFLQQNAANGSFELLVKVNT
jgi:Tfp pilus assembly protein PilN